MKKVIPGAAIFGVFFVVYMLISAPVIDKGAFGVAGSKHFQVLVDYRHLGIGQVWIDVPESMWDRCRIGGRFPQCGG